MPITAEMDGFGAADGQYGSRHPFVNYRFSC